ncbi:hypothetical protein KKC32_04455 [Patescibacteria group bacterium]|nr:hypothetical protein [Patescibacteria group bacterium]
MKNFPFGDLLKKAWKLTIRNVSLWWLGLLACGGSLMLQYDISDFQQMMADFSNGSLANSLSASMNQEGSFWIAMVAIILLLSLLFVLISLIARAGLIMGIGLLFEGGGYKFWQLVKVGLKKLPQLILLELVLLLVNVAVIAAPLYLYMSNSGNAVFLAILIIAAVLLVIYNLFVGLFKHFSYCFIVLENYKFWKAIKSGMKLLVNNFVITFVSKLIHVGLWLAIGFATILALVILMLPFVLSGMVSLLIVGKVGVIIIGILAAIVAFVAVLAIRGSSNTYLQSFATGVYIKLSK